eukprot:GHVS01072200.1.p1 GENE.GHVS01072200.1~~GHVS01072200.1.p1  ORF type:complete len:592 (+),score=154.10 GHVS01072200.1:46-1776(+)
MKTSSSSHTSSSSSSPCCSASAVAASGCGVGGGGGGIVDVGKIDITNGGRTTTLSYDKLFADLHLHSDDKKTGGNDGGRGGGERRRETCYSEDLSQFTVPRRSEEQTELMEKYQKQLSSSVGTLKNISLAFQKELDTGLLAHRAHPHKWIPEECSFKMLDSCVAILPTGNEKGVYYALDFGGTNFRAVRVALVGNGHVQCTQAKFSLKYEGPSGHDKGLLDGRASATQLFDHFATRVRTVMEESDDLQKAKKDSQPLGIGFTFSFPCAQTALDHATLVEWTKGFETGRETDDPVEGKDVGVLMTDAFKRNDVPASLSAIANDTVGTLLSCAYQKPANTPPCLVGVILGTGMNGCYVEPKYKQFGYVGQIINVECGNFNKQLPLTEVDAQVDWETGNRGRQLLEKLCSGAYLGELIRHTFLRVFRNRAPPKAWTKESFSSEDAAIILGDNSDSLNVSYDRMLKKWDVSMAHQDLVDLQMLCALVFDRSASLAGAAICAMCTKTEQLSVGMTVAVDGSLYVKNPWYARRVKAHIADILGEQVCKNIHILAADDGSGQGAAILAAANPAPSTQQQQLPS